MKMLNSKVASTDASCGSVCSGEEDDVEAEARRDLLRADVRRLLPALREAELGGLADLRLHRRVDDGSEEEHLATMHLGHHCSYTRARGPERGTRQSTALVSRGWMER